MNNKYIIYAELEKEIVKIRLLTSWYETNQQQ